MWLFTVILSSLVSLSVQASIQVRAQIHAIDEGKAGEDTLLLLTTGHVVRLGNNKSDIPFLQMKNAKSWLRFGLNKKHELESVTRIEPPQDAVKSYTFDSEEMYHPTVLESMDVAQTHFQTGRFVEKESQCYNRAHIWSYEWYLKNHIQSNKTWLFFTRKYIRKFKFEWWFHVSPSMHVKDNGTVREKIMDVKYARGPIDLKRWTDIFMRNNANCPVVKTYSDYANYPETGWCYVMRTSMFYYQPFDIEMKETWGAIKGNWYDSEVKAAYLEAFNESI